jgi:soluble P-type ATPase
VRELADRRARVQGLEVEANVDRRVEVDQAAEPVGVDVARVLDQAEHADPASLDHEM